MVFSIQILDRAHAPEMGSRRRLRSRNHLVNSPYWGKAGTVATAFGDIILASLRKGALAARQIAMPAIIVQALMAALAVSYFYAPAVKGAFEQIVLFKGQVGLPFAFLSMGCIAVLAEIMKRYFDPSSRATSFWPNAAYGFVVFGVLGLGTDAFYALQGHLWGSLPTGAQVPAKVLTDQFGWTVLIASPYQTLLYVLKDCNFSGKAFLERITPFRTFYVKEMLAVLVTNWAFWIPTTVVLYSLPVDLQFVIVQLAIVIWVLLLNAMTKRA